MYTSDSSSTTSPGHWNNASGSSVDDGVDKEPEDGETEWHSAGEAQPSRPATAMRSSPRVSALSAVPGYILSQIVTDVEEIAAMEGGVTPTRASSSKTAPSPLPLSCVLDGRLFVSSRGPCEETPALANGKSDSPRPAPPLQSVATIPSTSISRGTASTSSMDRKAVGGIDEGRNNPAASSQGSTSSFPYLPLSPMRTPKRRAHHQLFQSRISFEYDSAPTAATVLKLAKHLPSHFIYSNQEIRDLIQLDKLCGHRRATFVGHVSNDRDEASVRTNMPIPSAKSGFIGVYYFEVRIVSKGRDGWMGIGLCGRDANMDRLPGWDSRSYGYHGADGYIFEGSSKGKAYGPTYTTGDYIGCIVNLLNNTVSFTKNGLHLGVAFQSQKIVQQTLYPAVGFRTPGESMEINFGSSGVPFQFDIAEYVFQQQVEIWSKISKVRLPISSETGSRVESSLPAAFAESDMKLRQDRFDETPSLLLHPLITDYLEHEGYHETALLMRQHMADGSGRWNAINEMDVDTINPKETSGNFRKEIRSLIMKGHITLAISSINSNFPAFFDTNRHVLFALKCREFIEAVRRAQVQRDLSEPQSSEGSIIQLGREIVQMFSQDAERSVHVHAALVETFGVLAYENDNLLTKKKEFQGNYDAGKSMVDSKMNSHASLTVDVDADVDMDARNGSPMPDWVQRLFDGSVGDHIASLVDAGLQRQFGVEMAESVLERNLRQAIATARAVRKNGGGVCVGRDVLGRVWTDAPDV